MTLEQQVRLWVEQGEHDLRTAALVHEHGVHDQCAVSCEQGSEKLLKALWIYRNRQGPPRHHRIEELARSLSAPPEVLAATRLLEPDYILARYPDGALVTPYTQYNAADSEARLRAAEEIAGWVRQRLAEEGCA